MGSSGNVFTSRSAAVQDFQSKYAKSYPSTFSREPASRPSYIPQTILIDNRSYPVYYDWSHGGYGYWTGSTWHTYEVVRDLTMLGLLMNQHHYSYYDGYNNYGYGPPPAYVHSAGLGSAIGVFCVILLIIGAIIVLRILF